MKEEKHGSVGSQSCLGGWHPHPRWPLTGGGALSTGRPTAPAMAQDLGSRSALPPGPAPSVQ